MANSVLLDTNGWIALLHAKEAMHQQASAVWRDLGTRNYHVVITDWVIAETGNAFQPLAT